MGREISQLGLCKGPKHELTDEFYGFIKWRKRSIFVIDSYLKDSAFTKRGAKFQTRYVKGVPYHLSIECLRKGYLFRENPRINICCVPPQPHRIRSLRNSLLIIKGLCHEDITVLGQLCANLLVLLLIHEIVLNSY